MMQLLNSASSLLHTYTLTQYEPTGFFLSGSLKLTWTDMLCVILGYMYNAHELVMYTRVGFWPLLISVGRTLHTHTHTHTHTVSVAPICTFSHSPPIIFLFQKPICAYLLMFRTGEGEAEKFVSKLYWIAWAADLQCLLQLCYHKLSWKEAN